MPINLRPRAAKELNVRLFTAFEQGAAVAAQQTSHVDEVFRKTTIDTSEGVYLYPQKSFDLRKRLKGDEFETDGVKMYEARLPSGEGDYLAIEVDLNKYQDDKVGEFGVVFYRLGFAAAFAPSELCEEFILNDAATTTCYDGGYLLAQNHPQRPKETGGTAWSNDIVQAGGLTFQNFSLAVAAMKEFPREDKGKSAKSRPTKLKVPPVYEGIGRDICYNDRPSGMQGGGNPWVGQYELEVVENWAGDTRKPWFLFDDRDPMAMPAIFQEREPVALKPVLTDPSNPLVLMNRKLIWMVEGRLAVGPGDPTKILRSRLS